MPAPHVLDFVYVIVVLAGGVIAGFAPFVISDIFRPRTVNKKTMLTYCLLYTSPSPRDS